MFILVLASLVVVQVLVELVLVIVLVLASPVLVLVPEGLVLVLVLVLAGLILVFFFLFIHPVTKSALRRQYLVQFRLFADGPC